MNNTQSSKTIKARHKKAFILCALILAFTLLFTTLASAISSDEAIAIVSVQNNYLRTGESALVLQGLLTYSGDKYLIVAIKKNDTITVYVPIKNSSGEITTRDMETRELIKTAIIYSRMIQKNQETQAANWPFSYSTKSYFEDLANGLSTLKNSAVTVETELDKIDTTETKSLANDAHALKLLAEEFAQSSSIFAQRVDESRKYEQEYFNNPDANKNIKYEEFYRNYFSQAAVIKEDYQNITSKLNALGQAIGALETNQVTIDQKSSFQAILKMPTDAARLPTFFSQNDQFRTEIESIFNESRNSENYATTLATRKSRNSAWQTLYGRSEELLKIDKGFDSLQSAASAILSTENVNNWKNQDAVSGLKTNWAGAESRFTNEEYDKAKDFAARAVTNIKQIITEGAKETVTESNDILIKAVIGLIAVAVAIFLIENLVLKKKKKEEDYNEPNY